jgi:hypothetical protein
MGKYTAFRHKLPAYEQSAEASGLAAWFAKVDAYKQQLVGAENFEHANAAYLAREYAERDAKKKQLEALISQLNIELEAISQIGVAALEESGTQKIDLAAGGSVSIKDTPYWSITDRAAVVAWLKKNKMSDLLTINYQTLSGLCNERLVKAAAEGKPLTGIPGTNPFIKTKLAVRGVSKDSDEE